MAAESKRFGQVLPGPPCPVVDALVLKTVDSGPPTCKHAIHEFSEPTLLVLQLVAPLTARGPVEKM